jgi:4-diphosphocytidyl-2C-methyl-D-erythritol kinase
MVSVIACAKGYRFLNPQQMMHCFKRYVLVMQKNLGRALSNDLQSAACSLRPALRLVLDVGHDYGALGCIVSGSGPTVAFLVDDEEKALDLTVALSASGVVAGVARCDRPNTWRPKNW